MSGLGFLSHFEPRASCSTIRSCVGRSLTNVTSGRPLTATIYATSRLTFFGLLLLPLNCLLLQNGIKENQTNVNCFECIVQGGVQINCLACYIYCVTSAHDSSHRRRAYRGEQRPPSDCALLKKLDSKLYAQNQTVLGFTSAPAQTKWSTNSAQNWYKPVVWLPKTIILNMGDRLIITCSVISHFKPGIKTEYSFDVKVISNGVRKTQYSQQTTLKYDDIRPDMIQYNDGERQ